MPAGAYRRWNLQSAGSLSHPHPRQSLRGASAAFVCLFVPTEIRQELKAASTAPPSLFNGERSRSSSFHFQILSTSPTSPIFIQSVFSSYFFWPASIGRGI